MLELCITCFVHLCLYLHPAELSSFMVPTLWFIDLTVSTCHIEYTFQLVYAFFNEKMEV